MRSPPADFGALTPEEHQRLSGGEHEALATALGADGRHALAGWVREQIWDFEGAAADYRAGGRLADALRAALDSGSEALLDAILEALEQPAAPEFDTALELLRRRRRNMEVARLLSRRDAAPHARAEALLSAGNRVAAAEALADAGRPRDALEALALDDRTATDSALALAARLSWALGDAEGAARRAQIALRRSPERSPRLAALLARALGSLGHDLAAQLVLERYGAQPSDDTVPGRYRVTGLLPTGLAGAAYVGVDRLTLQEVELHLLLAEQPDPIDPRIAAAVDRFTATARAASELGHPAIRPVLRTEPAAGLLVLARAEGPPIRQLIRPPGLVDAVPRARALIAFLLEGVMAGHQRGLVHGAILPSQVVTDALGRPQLGPFGAHHLAGLAATRTGGLEELLVMTAPELRQGGRPTPACDVYAAGIMFHALLTGRLRAPEHDADRAPDVGTTPETSPAPTIAASERTLIERMTAADPELRPSAAALVEQLRTPVADVRELARGSEAAVARAAAEGAGMRMQVGVEVAVAEGWTPELLDALCEAANPWHQTVLDRTDRGIVLARWPEGSRVLDATADGWRRLIPAAALELPEALRDAIEARLRASSVVVTAAGPCMLALDDLLTR